MKDQIDTILNDVDKKRYYGRVKKAENELTESYTLDVNGGQLKATSYKEDGLVYLFFGEFMMKGFQGQFDTLPNIAFDTLQFAYSEQEFDKEKVK